MDRLWLHVKGEQWRKTIIKGAQNCMKVRYLPQQFGGKISHIKNKPPKTENLHFLTSLFVHPNNQEGGQKFFENA